MLIKDELINVNRQYVFIQLGGNQVRSVDSNKVFGLIIDMVVAIRQKSPGAKIYFITVLPRPVDNSDIKPFIVKFNRWLTAVVQSANELFEKIKILLVHLKFINAAQPRVKLFNAQDGCTLNEAGAIVFKKEVFQLATFVKNTQ